MRGVVFDLDGTLVDSAPPIAAALTQLRQRRGIARAVSVSDVHQWIGLGGAHVVRMALGHAEPADVAEFRSIYGSIDGHVLYEGVAETLASLAGRGLRLGVCTNKPQQLSEKVLAEVGLDHYFPVVVGGDAIPHPKPDGRHLLAVLEPLKVPAAAAIYVGDSSIDRRAADAAGVTFVLAAWGYQDDGVADGLRIETPMEILRAL